MGKPSTIYEEVTNRIIEELKNNVVPWVRPWTSAISPFPCNATSQHPYSGINILLLWAAAAKREYSNPSWLTYKQAEKLGGTIKKGEKATAIVYAATVKKVAENGTSEKEEKNITFLKFYSVFNIEQTSGLPNQLHRITELKPIGARLFHVEAFLRRVGADVRHGGDKAYYSPSDDYIALPRMEDFESLGHYYATSLHEHVHCSGHPKRLNRDLTGRFRSRSYAAEELIAELGAAFLCSFLEIKAELRHASYIASWLELLENDNRAIFTAASAASKAADYLRSFSNVLAPQTQ